MSILSKIQALLARIGRVLQSPVLLVIRLYWGWQFFVTGKAHLIYLDKTAGYFASLGIPMPRLNAIVVGSTECAGGLLLLAGLFSRFATLALIFDMCVALWVAERPAVLAIFSDPDKLFGTDPFLFLYASVLVFAFGPGKIALDTLIFKDKAA
jgi:putative oxidoreductase